MSVIIVEFLAALLLIKKNNPSRTTTFANSSLRAFKLTETNLITISS